MTKTPPRNNKRPRTEGSDNVPMSIDTEKTPPTLIDYQNRNLDTLPTFQLDSEGKPLSGQENLVEAYERVKERDDATMMRKLVKVNIPLFNENGELGYHPTNTDMENKRNIYFVYTLEPATDQDIELWKQGKIKLFNYSPHDPSDATERVYGGLKSSFDALSMEDNVDSHESTDMEMSPPFNSQNAGRKRRTKAKKKRHTKKRGAKYTLRKSRKSRR
jgi:hypothetical protein